MDAKRRLRLNIATKVFAAKVAMQTRVDSKQKQSGKSLAKESLTLADALISMEETLYGELT